MCKEPRVAVDRNDGRCARQEHTKRGMLRALCPVSAGGKCPGPCAIRGIVGLCQARAGVGLWRRVDWLSDLAFALTDNAKVPNPGPIEDAEMVIRNRRGEGVVPAERFFMGPAVDITRMTILEPKTCSWRSA